MAEPAEQIPVPPLVVDGDNVAIRDPDGTVSYVQKDDLQGALAEGARPATETEWQAAKLGTGGQIASAAIGAGQGITFGFGAPALIKGAELVGADETAADLRRGVKIARDTSPNAYLAGELGGALFTGAPPEAAAEEIAGSVASRAVQRGIRAAPGAIGTGAAIGIGGQATEDAIENKDFDASAYLTAGTKGGVVGLLTGAPLSAGLGHVGDRAVLFGRRSEGALEREAVTGAEEATGRVEQRKLSQDLLDAGLYEKPGAIETPFRIGGKRHSVSLDQTAVEDAFAGVPRGVAPIAPEPVLVRRGFAANEVEPAESTIEKPFTIGRGVRVREDDLDFGHVDAERPILSRIRPVERGATVETERAAMGVQPYLEERFGVRASQDAGLLGDEGERNVFRISRAKNAPRTVGLGDVEQEGLIDTRLPLRVSQPTEGAVEQAAAEDGKRGVSAWLEAQANKQAFKATGAKAGDIRRLASNVDEQQAEIERIGARLRGEAIEGKPLVEATASQAEIAKRITDRANEVGKELGAMRAELDKAASRPSMNDIVQRFEAEVGRPADRMPMGEQDVAAARAYLADMVKKGGERPEFTTLYQFRRRLGDKLRKEFEAPPGMPVPAGKDAMMRLERIVEDEFTKAGERASTELGSTFASNYKLKKSLYADLATARKIAKGEAERNAGANFISLTDAIAGFSTGGLKGVAAIAANQVRRKFGNQIAADVLGKAARLTDVQSAANRMDAALDKGTKSFLDGGASTEIRPPRKVTAEEVRSIRDAVSSPAAVQARIADALGTLSKYAPTLSASMATRVAATAAFLRDNLPKEPPPPAFAFSKPKPRPLSDTELQRAGQMIEVAEDPSVVVDRMLDGRLARTHVEALKASHPEVYAQIQTYLRQHGEQLRHDLPLQKQVALSLLFGEPITEAMLPENVRAFQATFVDGSQAPAQDMSAGGAGLPVRGLKTLGASRATANDQIERGDA